MKTTSCTYISVIAHEFKGHLSNESEVLLSNLIGRNQEQVAKLNLTTKEFLHFRLHSCESEKFVEFELRALNDERVSEPLSLSKGPAAEVFT